MAQSASSPGWASRALIAVGVLVGAGVAVLAVWLIGWAMVERAAGPITAWVSSTLVVLAGALWGIRAGVRIARYFAPTAPEAPTADTDSE